MNKLVRTGLLGLSLSLSTAGSTAVWKTVSNPLSPQRVEVDLTTVSRAGDIVTLWTRVEQPPAGSDGAVKVGHGDGTPYLMQVSCTARLIRISTVSAPVGPVNPFGPADPSPYTFQVVNNGVASSVTGAACGAPVATANAAPAPDPGRRNITPRRTSQRRNPWPYTANRGY